MKKMMTLLFAGFGLGMLNTGCMTVTEGNQTFAIRANKMIIGKSFEEAEAKIPDGATVLQVVHVRGPLLGLVQQTYIAGTK